MRDAILVALHREAKGSDGKRTRRLYVIASRFADCEIVDGLPVIRVSAARNGHAVTLLATIAHEMVHVRQFLVGDSANHNALFRRLAARVCRVHGFDIKTF